MRPPSTVDSQPQTCHNTSDDKGRKHLEILLEASKRSRHGGSLRSPSSSTCFIDQTPFATFLKSIARLLPTRKHVNQKRELVDPSMPGRRAQSGIRTQGRALLRPSIFSPTKKPMRASRRIDQHRANRHRRTSPLETIETNNFPPPTEFVLHMPRSTGEAFRSPAAPILSRPDKCHHLAGDRPLSLPSQGLCCPNGKGVSYRWLLYTNLGVSFAILNSRPKRATLPEGLTHARDSACGYWPSSGRTHSFESPRSVPVRQPPRGSSPIQSQTGRQIYDLHGVRRSELSLSPRESWMKSRALTTLSV